MKANFGKSKVRNVLIALYVLTVLGFSAAARAEVSILPIQKGSQALVTHVGQIAVTVDQHVYLVVSEDEVYELRGDEEKLMAFNGLLVSVRGFEPKYKSGPVHQLASFVPLIDDVPADRPSALFVVVEISEISY